MSKRNSQEAKRVARERLRAEREKEAKKAKMRRQLGVAGAVVAALAVMGGIGFAVTKMLEPENQDWSDAQKVAEGASSAGRYSSYEAPANTEGRDGVDIVIGDKDAKNTVSVYEDMRCPVCASFEQLNGNTISKDIEEGKYKAEFVFGTFLDRNPAIAGTGSRNALSALGAALNVSPEAFLEYKKILFSSDVHPDEGKDDFGSDKYLINAAQDVKDLKGNKSFEDDVNNGTFDPWALKVSKKFDDDKDVTGTPSIKLNGKKVETAQGGAPMTPDQFREFVHDRLEK
ncbi:thioredoxin domain-containing protein [Streptomyces sp. OF3]|uniref:Thioredoxin domain-containing protein n=1 Tax=Streptomyces alkaliterrae TaxID=2213162 RepID=A0A7W3ZM78_9ACTN|nr:thioredoxin domain-containing protein [Streptomyces alkaliterrae]MBB1253255.1 thioredoxin domain-containing protein [Streptomyces alkaliterrae]